MMHNFFISYTRVDQAWAEWIAWQLEAAGYTTVLQAWDFRPGTNFVQSMQQAAASAERTIAVLSPDYLTSRFTQPEWAAAFAQDPTGEQGLLLPIRIRECNLQGLLPQLVYINLVGLEEDTARETLLRGVCRGRAKPSTPPGFPGAGPRPPDAQPSFPGSREVPPPKPTASRWQTSSTPEVRATRQRLTQEFNDVDMRCEVELPVVERMRKTERPDVEIKYVFISCLRQETDVTLAQAFTDALNREGYPFFNDTKISWGANWFTNIREALEKADYFLVLLTQEAAASEIVAEEIKMAQELAYKRDGRPIILPIRIRYPFTEDLPYAIARYLDEIQQENWDSPDDTSRLVEKLLATIQNNMEWHSDSTSLAPAESTPPSKPPYHFDPRSLLTPGGALDIDSRFYIERDTDAHVFEALQRPRALVTIRGARQTGKTSLIMRMYAALRLPIQHCRTAFVDLQALPHHEFQSLSTIWRAIANAIAIQLQLDDWDDTRWQLNGSYDRQFSWFLDHSVFEVEQTPLLICLDEVDRVFHTPIRSEFFASLRAFYNRGAIDPTWKQVRWLLGTSSEPSFFIDDLSQSPFNIGYRAQLSTFTCKEVTIFASRFGLIYDSDSAVIEKIMNYVGGQPYLVHLLLYHFVSNPEGREGLFDATDAGGGVFRDHLHRYLIQFQQDSTLATAMKDIVAGKGCKDAQTVDRLEAAGLVRRDAKDLAVPLCQLYIEFFGQKL